jgi:low temperature requirement protein LtrA
MPLIQVVVILLVVGVILWLIQTYVPMAAPIKQIITAVVVIAVVLWLLSLFVGPNFFGGLWVGHR